MSTIAVPACEEPAVDAPTILRVAHFGPPDLLARGAEAVVRGDRWLHWLGQEQDPKSCHLLVSRTAVDVLIVRHGMDPDGRVLASLRDFVSPFSTVVLGERDAISPENLRRAIHLSRGQAVPAGVEAPGRTARTLVTAAELEVLSLVSEGFRTEAIAELLRISPNTVKKRAQRLFMKLRVRDRAHAVAKAYEYGLLPHGPGR
ncbi:LuxR C-terminal-related transcriptional regulator [Amycolatopsis sp. GM8]|uniref:helix-turn-helix transcriptional regulator n=1 Tax=Amycolatopsis sp. GM8 TaxID=2896530 RepID=UPI001EFF84D7|nr:LuxR C-terminal-related transcriptional regulator [Amycolatopsis sp. GM8]